MEHEKSTDIFSIIATNNNTGLIRWLNSKPDLEIRNGQEQTPLMAATYANNIIFAGKLIEAGANVNAQDNMLNSPFLYAGASGLLEIVKMCMKAGPDYRVFNRYNGTALIPACEKGHVTVVQELLKDKNFPINHINKLGWTALLEAVILGDGKSKQIEIVQLLVDAGCDTSIRDRDGLTALDNARRRNFTDIIHILEKNK